MCVLFWCGCNMLFFVRTMFFCLENCIGHSCHRLQSGKRVGAVLLLLVMNASPKRCCCRVQGKKSGA